MSSHYEVIGQNNRNTLVQSKKVAPYHEDITRFQPFEPSQVHPGEYARIKLDMKHGRDREIILNDIRLRFNVDFGARANTGRVYAVRGTDLIRELTIKINEDIVFKTDKRFELSMLWEMNNHKTAGNPASVNNAHLLNHSNIPAGSVEQFVLGTNAFTTAAAGGRNWITDTSVTTGATPGTPPLRRVTVPGEERHDGRPRLIYDDSSSPTYSHKFDISLNQLVGPIFNRLHLRRVEFIQIEILFEPWLSLADTQNILLFGTNPVGPGALVHPYSVVRFTNLEIRQYRSTFLDGVTGFTLPDNKMLSWLMHRYSRREYTFDFTTQTSIDIKLSDWELRTNITRVWWMIAPRNGTDAQNVFIPFGEPSSFDVLSGVEILWKNDKVLDLDTTHQVQRHYILSDNKRYGFDDPFIRFARLTPNPDKQDQEIDGKVELYNWWSNAANPLALTAGEAIAANNIRQPIGKRHYEFPIYHVDLNMNIQQGVPGAEIVGGIVNDTSDYVIRIKRLADYPQFLGRTLPTVDANLTRPFVNEGVRTLWVFLEYETLVNLSANSNQYNRGSQTVTKQLNSQ